MAATLDDTVAGPAANTYTDLAEFKAYLESRLYATSQLEADDELKKQALIMATRLLSSEVCWTGSPTTTSQALPWPRTGMTDRNGNPIASMSIPMSLKDMESELAYLMMQRDRTAETDAMAQGLTRLTAGPVTLEFSADGVTLSVVPPSVKGMGVPSWFCPDGGAGADATDDLTRSVIQVV
jgi:hypothetical protein